MKTTRRGFLKGMAAAGAGLVARVTLDERIAPDMVLPEAAGLDDGDAYIDLESPIAEPWPGTTSSAAYYGHWHRFVLPGMVIDGVTFSLSLVGDHIGGPSWDGNWHFAHVNRGFELEVMAILHRQREESMVRLLELGAEYPFKIDPLDESGQGFEGQGVITSAHFDFQDNLMCVSVTMEGEQITSVG